jgi:methylase of polypeptide subunit release factors
VTAPHLAEPDDTTLAGLREALRQADYTSDRISDALGPRPPLRLVRREVYLRRLAEAGPLGTLTRLFRLREPVGADEAAAALRDLDALVEAGFVERSGDECLGQVEISEYEGLLLVHDRADGSRPAEGWEVLFGAASRTLAALTIRRPARRALDLGTGCGVQALLAARHAESVVATDLGERALAFTRINARLNEVDNVEPLRGDFFEPVEGERFGLIASNPPFVISPENDILFRDSQLPRDELSRVIVGEAQEHLEEGGHATVLISWVAPPEDHWSSPLQSWARTGCDAVFLQFTSVRPLQYAAMWTDRLDRWLDYYRAEGMEWISTGAAVVRRKAPGGRVVSFQATAGPRTNATDQLLRVFDALEQDAVVESLLDRRFRLVEHRLDQVVSWRDGAYAVELTGVAIEGTPLNARVETDAIHVLARIDGRRTLAEAIDLAAEETGLDREQIEQAALKTARRLFERGFLDLVEDLVELGGDAVLEHDLLALDQETAQPE